MISAKLIKNLEKKGFELEFPSYNSNNEIIIEIIKEKNERLYLAMPLILKEEFDYKKIIKRLGKQAINELNRIILITNRIFIAERIENKFILEIIKQNKIKGKINNSEFNYYCSFFLEFEKNKEFEKEEILKKHITNRTKLTLNISLSKIFAPAKIRIMKKIFNHEKLTNTELKYYYKAIKPLIISISNKDMQKYLEVVENTKIYSEK